MGLQILVYIFTQNALNESNNEVFEGLLTKKYLKTIVWHYFLTFDLVLLVFKCWINSGVFYRPYFFMYNLSSSSLGSAYTRVYSLIFQGYNYITNATKKYVLIIHSVSFEWIRKDFLATSPANVTIFQLIQFWLIFRINSPTKWPH